MSWTTPWALGLLPLVALWAVLRWRGLRPVDLPTLQHSPLVGGATWGVIALLALESAGAALAVVAFAGPTADELVTRHEEPGIDLALVLDISASMQAADLKPNRLEVLKQVASALVKGNAGNRVGVYAFAGFCTTHVPFTTDQDALLTLLDSLSYRSIVHDEKAGATAIGDALLIAGDDLRQLRLPGRDQLVILATDGQSNRGFDPVQAARQLAADGVALHVIGIGDDASVPVFVDGKPFIATDGRQLHTRLEDAQLREIAATANGSYARAASNDALAATFARIEALHAQPLEARTVRVAHPLSPRLALVCAVLLAAWLALDGLWLRRPLR